MSLKVHEILKVAEKRLADEGCMDPRIDAELLFCYVMKADRTYLFSHSADVLDERRCDMYFDVIDIRASGVPVQHILGHQEFMGIRFKVSDKVLIPRQDTETLVEKALEILKEEKPPMGGFEVLDLCCGSGAIAVSMAYYLPKIKVTATDLSEEALDVARENAAGYKPCKNIKFIQGDLFSPFPKDRKGKGKKLFDMILSNPPYIRSDVIPTLQREVSEHEPLMALDGGEDGLELYRRIAQEASDHLKKHGWMLLEIGHDQAAAVSELLDQQGHYAEIEVIKDLAGHDRVVKCRRKAR